MDSTEEEITGVDDDEGTLGMDDTLPGVNDQVENEATPGVDDDAPGTTNESDEAEIEQTIVKRMSGAMNLHRQTRNTYVFNITDETQHDGIIFMQLKYKEDSDTFNVTEDEFDKGEAE